MRVTIEEDMERPRRGVWHEDTISSRLSTFTLKDIFESLDWQDKAINKNGTWLNHLRFDDDIVLINSSPNSNWQQLGSFRETRIHSKVLPVIAYASSSQHTESADPKRDGMTKITRRMWWKNFLKQSVRRNWKIYIYLDRESIPNELCKNIARILEFCTVQCACVSGLQFSLKWC